MLEGIFPEHWGAECSAPGRLEEGEGHPCPGVTREKGTGHKLLKECFSPRTQINQLESNGTKMADKTRP